jgi:hypothetical protein
MNVIFVKWGTKYSSEDVNTLYNNLKKYNNKHTYYCYTDNSEGLDKHIDVIWIPSSPRLKKWWNKLRMFAQEFPIEGKCMFFDIDTVIKNDPFKILDQIDFNKLTILDCPWKTDPIYSRATNYDVRIASGVITWTAGNHTEMWENFISNKDYFLRKYKGIDRYIVHENYSYETFPHTYIQSYKYQKEIDYEPAIMTYEEVNFESRNIK